MQVYILEDKVIMKSTKLLALLLTICLIFSFTACDTLSGIIKKYITPDSEKNEVDEKGDGARSPINVIMVNDNHGVLGEDNASIFL